jgi:Helix-turn-helix domain
MAATLTTDHTIYATIPITKFEEDADGNLVVYGKATDGRVDADDQIVDSQWSAKAVASWLDSGGNVRVQHNPQLYPAGRGLSVEVDRDGDGGHWVKSLIVEPTAKALVRHKVLRAYSVGIAKPVVHRDITGKARGGVVAGGEIAEISLVDRPANSGCGITLVKSADDPREWTYGDLAVLLAKAEQDEASKKPDGDEPDDASNEAGAAPDDADDHGDTSAEGADDEPDGDELHKYYARERAAWQAREPRPVTGDDLSSGTAFLAKMAAASAWKKWDAEGDEYGYTEADGFERWCAKRKFDPGVGGGVDRDKLPESDFGGPDRSYPIVSPDDVTDAARLIGHADDPTEVKRRVRRIARRKGPRFEAKIPDSWDGVTAGNKNISTTAPLATGFVPFNLAGAHPLLDEDDERKDDMVEAELTKAAGLCPSCGKKLAAGGKRCISCGKKVPRSLRIGKALVAELTKVGPKGYIHGWILVGAPGRESHHVRHLVVGMKVHHPEHGEGTVKRVGAKTATVEHAGGKTHSYEIGYRGDGAHPDHFVERGHPDLISENERDRRSAKRLGELAGEARARAGRVGPSKKERRRGVASPRDVERRAWRRQVEQSRATDMSHTARRLDADVRAREARDAGRKAPKPVEPTTGPGIDSFGGRSRTAWQREARQFGRREQGLNVPRGAPAHEIARAIGEHDTRHALGQHMAINPYGPPDAQEHFGVDRYRPRKLTADERQQYIEHRVDRFNAEHAKKVQAEMGAGPPPSPGPQASDAAKWVNRYSKKTPELLRLHLQDLSQDELHAVAGHLGLDLPPSRRRPATGPDPRWLDNARATIYNHLTGIRATGGARKASPRVLGAARAEMAKDAVKRYVSGESIKDIAAHHGRSYAFMHRILTEAGVQLRPRGAKRAKRGGKSAGGADMFDMLYKGKKRRLLPDDVKPAGPHREPDGDAVEQLEADAGMSTTPDAEHDDIPASVMKSYAAQRMHDALCPALDWDDVSDTYPALKSVADAMDPTWFHLAVLKAAGEGDAASIAWAGVLRENAEALAKGVVDPAALADARAELAKAFLGHEESVPAPGDFRRDYIDAGHAPLNAATPRPAAIPSSAHVVHPDDFHRGLITEGHQAPSPTSSGDSLDTGGSVRSGASRTFYTNATREAARNAMAAMHDHIAATFPDMCHMAKSRPVLPPDMRATAQPTATSPAPTTRAPGEITKKQMARLIKSAVAEATDAVRTTYQTQLDELQAQLDELGAQPDSTQAPLRGVVRKAVDASEGNLDKSHAPPAAPPDEVAFAQRFLNHPSPAMRAQAEDYLRGLLATSS